MFWRCVWILSSLCIGGSGSELLGQKSDYPKAFWLGIKGGMHLSRYQFVPSVAQSSYLGQGGGLVSRLDLEQGASLQLELSYERVGWQEKFDDATLSFKKELSYIEFPFLTHLYLERKGIRGFVNLGPYIGYNIGDQSLASGTSFTSSQMNRQTMGLKHRVSWGLLGGPGVSFKIGQRHRFELEARIQYNFQDIWGNQRTDPYGQSSELRFGANLNYLFKF